jgi:hypothetical protein
MTRQPSTFKMRDITRAPGVAASVDILRDGTLRLTPMAPEAPAPDAKAKDNQPAAAGLRSWD